MFNDPPISRGDDDTMADSDTPKEQRVFVNAEGMAIFICPKCETTNTADVQKFASIQKAVRLKARCTCGHVYKAILERRRYYRKSVHLRGTYAIEGRPDHAPLTVVDISMTGLKFTTRYAAGLKRGTPLILEFQLDDLHATRIQKQCVVRSVTSENVGVEFAAMDAANTYDKALGFYLMR